MPDEQNAQDAPRKELVAGSVNDAEKAVIEEARVLLGYGTMSPYVRDVMLEHARGVVAAKRPNGHAA